MYFWIVRLLTCSPSLSNSPWIRSAPRSRFCAAISLINATVSAGIFSLEDATLDEYFQNSRNPIRCQREIRLWLDNEQRLLPCPNHPCEKHQEHAIHFGACGSFDLSAQDNKRLSEERVFCHEFGLRSGEVSHGSQRERGVGWLCPVDEAVLERLKADAYQCPDEGEKTMHGVQYPF